MMSPERLNPQQNMHLSTVPSDTRSQMTKPVPAAWIAAIDDFTLALRAGGSPATTITTRRSHLARVGRCLGGPGENPGCGPNSFPQAAVLPDRTCVWYPFDRKIASN